MASTLAIVPTAPDPFAGQLIWQPYRGKYGGRDPRGALLRDLDRAVAGWGLRTVMWHGFPRELHAAWDGLRDAAGARGVVPTASWGLDGRADNDGTPLTAVEKGDLVGRVLAPGRGCVAGWLDAEGQWDTDQGPADDMDEAGAVAFCGALRVRAPDALVADQPWPAIDQHGALRKSARPLEAGGVFAGFPVDEFAATTNLGRYRQCYWANWKRPDRYDHVAKWMDDDWARITPALRAAGLERPLRVTIQGYGHDDRPWDLARCLLDRQVARRESVVLWCEPYPSAVTVAVIRGVRRLVQLGHAGPGIAAVDAVRAFQRSYNRAAPSAKRLVEDGRLGLASLAILGVTP